ncbi:MAG: TIM barrel protein [Sporomusaceae bacterium]|nr:TIM barrel protein [Sporomusaceae bacterium]
MLQFSANLNFLFQETDFFNRFQEASQAGFKAVEFMFPYSFAPAELKKALEDNSLRLVLFNLPAGDWAKGERGIANDPARQDEFQEGVRTAIKYAHFLDVKQVNCLCGKKVAGIEETLQRETLLANLRFAAAELQNAGIKLLLEFVNNYDIPAFYPNTTANTLALLNEVAHPNLYLQYDIYHAQRSEGELIATINKNSARIAHIQIADNPGRHEPGTGEINCPAVFKAIEVIGYNGYIGLEYNPTTSTLASLGWVKEFGLNL